MRWAHPGVDEAQIMKASTVASLRSYRTHLNSPAAESGLCKPAEVSFKQEIRALEFGNLLRQCLELLKHRIIHVFEQRVVG